MKPRTPQWRSPPLAAAVAAASTLLVALLCVSTPSGTLADLPSCYRARCVNCAVLFIQQMCPNACANCPQTYSRATSENRLVAHGQPIVYQHVPTQLSTQIDARAQTAHDETSGGGGRKVPQTQPLPLPTYQAPSPQQQLVASQSQYAPQPPPQQQSFYSPYDTSGGQYVPFGAPVTFAPPLQFGAGTSGSGGNGFSAAQPFGGFAPAAAATTGVSDGGAPAVSMFNPFAPFLTQTFAAQQQQATIPPPPPPPPPQQSAFNPFTFPTLPPAPTFAPFTPAPISMSGGGGAFAPFVTPPPPPASSYQQPAPSSHFTYVAPADSRASQYSAGNSGGGVYSEPRVVQPEPQQTEKYSTSSQTSDGRPRQVYTVVQPAAAASTNSQGGGESQYVNGGSAQLGYIQPGVAPGESARSIDSAPIQVDKPGYLRGGGLAPSLVQQCPKQPNWEPCISKELANERFRNCCIRLGDGCSQLCNYDSSLTTIQLAVLTGRCPVAKVADMMICASGYEDASSCCAAYGVLEPGFEHCRPYCNPAAGLPNDGNIAEKYKCLSKLSQIQRCFYVSQRP